MLLCPTVLALAGLLAAPARGADDAILLIDGRTVRGRVTAIDDRRVTVEAAGAALEAVPRDGVLTVTFAGAAPADLLAEAGRAVLLTDDGGQVAVLAPTIADGRLLARSPVLGAVAVPLERVARLLLARPGERPADLLRQCESLGLVRDARDRLVLSARPGQWTPLAGLLKALDATRVVFQYDQSETILETATVAVIQPARVGADPPRAAGWVVAADGSRIALAAVTLRDGRVRASSASLGPVEAAVEALAAIRFASARITFLSDLEPSAVRQTGYLGDVFPYRRDRAVDGGPLRLGGTTYERGLGLHARCELVYDLGGRYRQFAAVAGIDDGSPLGSAYLSVLGDGRPLLDRLRLDRAAAPQTVRLDVAGVQRLTILGDFGDAAFGAGQRVDLADAKLLK